MSNEKIIERDDKLLRKEKLFRISRILAIFMLIVTLIFHINSIYPLKLDISIQPLILSIVCWFSVAGSMTLLLHHIDSIKLYRSKIKS